MAHSHFSKLVSRLHADLAFRNRFAAAPAVVLREEGYDPEMFVLPEKIDSAALGRRLEAVFGGKETVKINNISEVENLSASQLWERFSVIGLDQETRTLLDDGAAMAVVIYGSSLAVSNSNVAVVTNGEPLQIQTIDQLQVLRKLARLSKEQVTFSVSGPNGIAVNNVSVDVLTAFLARLGAQK